MKKEDYMKLSKERLAELLVEQEKTLADLRELLTRATAPPTIIKQEARPLCWEEGGTCMNPQMDCVNCPRHGYSGRTVTTTGGTWKV